MCGITGEVSWDGRSHVDDIAKMTQLIRHRGPDDQGIWQSSDQQCILGHARLSILDLSSAGHQPMVDHVSGNTIVFNGEIYNYQQRRKECEAAGYQFHSNTDTEVILALYRLYGTDCLKYLRGMFSFAIWNTNRKQLFIARDRVGKKPLNYAITSQGLIFCSEIDALVRHPSVSKDMDHEALELYLQCQYIPAPWTIYKQIRKLPPAHFAVCSRDGLHIEKYWDVNYRRKIKVTEGEALDALEEKLQEAVRLRMVSDVPLGALLSGGVDSSVIVALMAKYSDAPVRTFSIGFEEQSYNELPYAELVAERCATQHHPEVVKGNVEELLPGIAKHYGEPYADSSAVPSFYVCQYARKHVTVVLNGDGGDELLAGYPRYWLTPQTIYASRLLGNFHSPKWLAEIAIRLDKARFIHTRARRKWLLRVANPELQSILMYRAFWSDEERRVLLSNKYNSTGLLPRWREQWLNDARAKADNAIDRMLWIDNRTYLAGDLLVKMDIASMHCGLEGRSPLLDHEVIELCASFPVEMKVKRKVGKYLLKKLAERYFPKEFVHRRKMGFGIPLSSWLRNELRPMVMDVLSDPVTMEPLNGVVIKETLEQFYKGKIDHSSRIWSLLMYGVWKRECIL